MVNESLGQWGESAMKRCALTLVFALTAITGLAMTAQAANLTCTGAITGNVTGNVVVPPGKSCTVAQSTIAGNILVQQGASLTVQGQDEPSAIGGNIQADHCAS